MRKNRKNQINDGEMRKAPSTITRIVVIIIVLVLPVNIMTLVLSHMVIRKSTEQSFKEAQNNMDFCTLNLKETLSYASKRMTYLSYDDVDFLKLENIDPEEKEEIAISLYSVKYKIITIRQEYDVVDIVFYHFLKPDYTVMNGYTNISSQSYRKLVEERAEEEHGYGMVWEFCEIDGSSTLYGCSRWNGADFGAFLDLERTLTKMNLFNVFDNSTVFLMNAEGTLYTDAGKKYLEEEGKTLAEMKQSPRYHVLTSEVEGCDLILVQIVKGNAMMQGMSFSVFLLQIISIVLTVLVIPLLLVYIYRWVSLPLNRLIYGISRIERGDMDYRIKYVEQGREFEKINRNFNDMMDRVSELKIDIYEKELERKNIRMRYLSQQIQPHFILNAMNILYSYEPEEYPLIQRMILCISKYFRYIVKVNSRFVLLRQEMDHIQNYFEIQKARYPGMFSSSVEYNKELSDALIPPLLVQNFAENAIKYALKVDREAKICVTADYLGGDRRRKLFRICLMDTGEGMSDEVLEKIEIFRRTGVPQEGLGIGIQNSIERLKYLYDDKLSYIQFKRREDCSGTIVEIILPIHYPEDEGGNEYENFVD